jgi:hypothetical protein
MSTGIGSDASSQPVQGVDDQEFLIDFRRYGSLASVLGVASHVVIDRMTGVVSTQKGNAPDLSKYPDA